MASLFPGQEYLVNLEIAFRRSNRAGLSGFATLNFGEGEFTALGRKQRFAITACYVTYSAHGCGSPPDSWAFSKTVPKQLNKNVENTVTDTQSGTMGLSLDTALQTGPSAGTVKAGTQTSRSHERVTQEKAKFDISETAIWAQGGATNFRWRIAAPQSGEVLSGFLLQGDPVLDVVPNGPTAKLEATGLIPRGSIRILDEQLRYRSINKFKLSQILLCKSICEKPSLVVTYEVFRDE